MLVAQDSRVIADQGQGDLEGRGGTEALIADPVPIQCFTACSIQDQRAFDLLQRRRLSAHRKTQQPRQKVENQGENEWTVVYLTHLAIAPEAGQERLSEVSCLDFVLNAQDAVNPSKS
ncbi:conserved hypothetical protein [Mesorhizobium delmotii]|uniref:Uncharacterized protein n=1 Tax=Mesorhizobium delmotii TaxID=1631247 RepID=A0A2P9ASM6_9HYPH|nr:conserved hypothetical protein [Mesorhizobium delmotii]